METPSPPALRPIASISPTTYESALRCGARAAWASLGDRGAVPPHTSTVLGLSFHAVMAAANRGEIEGASEERRVAARRLFRDSAQKLFAELHPHLRAKFRTPEEFPFYNVVCEQAALQASVMEGRKFRPPASAAGGARFGGSRTEGRFASSDGRIIGRLDRINEAMECVIDYKSGRGGGQKLSDQERRQLRLYVHLALENGIKATRGMIVRSNGQQASEEISADQAAAEAMNALALLDGLNGRIEAGASFDDLASPSASSCGECPCIPFCNRFWEQAEPEWRDAVGCNVEGSVATAQLSSSRGVELIALTIEVERGTASAGPAAVQAFPRSWLLAANGEAPPLGSSIRIVNGRMIGEAPSITILVDRAAATLWSLKG